MSSGGLAFASRSEAAAMRRALELALEGDALFVAYEEPIGVVEISMERGGL